jgi:2-oxo-4-hydroxy-4-carboxy-5-ureidoimidazoline decarboxylase
LVKAACREGAGRFIQENQLLDQAFLAVFMTLAEVNSLDRWRFIEAIGWIFEHSPWVAERAWNGRPFRTVEHLLEAMVAQVAKAHPDEQRSLLCSHPDLGTTARVSSASALEQAGAGLRHLEPDEFDRFQRLNASYRGRFGFPFLFAVKGSTKYDILRALEQRLQAPPEAEYEEALRQVYRIAEFRLRDAVKDF